MPTITESKLEFIKGSELPESSAETAEAAYRRGYCDGYLVAMYEVWGLVRKNAEKTMQKMDDFFWLKLMKWKRSSFSQLLRNEDGSLFRGSDSRLREDAHYKPGFRVPPRFDPKED